MSEEIKTTETVEEVPARVNPFCVISKATFGEYAVHDIQTNCAWSSNPYGDSYAVVPDAMVEAIMETGGFCDLTFSEDGTEVISFTALEKPAPTPAPEPETPLAERVTTLEQTSATKEEVQAVWDSMAAAYTTGVQEA